MKKPIQFSPEVRERAVRLVAECRNEHPSQWAAIESIATKIGCAPQTLHGWIQRHEAKHGSRERVSATEKLSGTKNSVKSTPNWWIDILRSEKPTIFHKT